MVRPLVMFISEVRSCKKVKSTESSSGFLVT